VTGGDASVGADFGGDISGSLTWLDGDADPQTLLISITDDVDEETTEFFLLGLSNAQGATISNDATARVNISSNEGPAPPPAPIPTPPKRSSGGGSPSPFSLLILAGVFLRRINRKGAA
jgi:hypothetical protein